MKKIDVQTVLFDLDGVIIDSREAIANCVNFALEELGLDTRKKEEIY
jgi:phosphoglycolate phosphatase-like HAD superfamily hydrolase